MADYNLDHQNADDQDYGGVIREDVLNEIFDKSPIELPLTELCSKGTHSNRRVEYTEHVLEEPATDNAVVDGIDIDQDDTKLGDRVSNFTQISVKEIKVSHSAQAANSIGSQTSLAWQVMKRNQELRRDIEAQMLTHQGSVIGDGSTIPGVSAGLGAWLKDNVITGAGGSAGGFNFGTGVIDPPSPGTPEPLSETKIRDVLQSIYENGGDTGWMMLRTPVVRKLSEFMFSGNSNFATLTSDNNQRGEDGMKAYGSVNVLITDFGMVVKIKANHIQQQDAPDVSSAYFLDPAYLKQSFLRGFQVESLAKTGLSDKRLLSAEYSLLVLNQRSQGGIFDIDETADMVA